MKTMLPAVLVLLPFIGAFFSGIIGTKNEKARDYFADLIVIAEFVIMTYSFIRYSVTYGDYCHIGEICGLGLNFTFDGFRLLYGLVAAFMWMMTTILSRSISLITTTEIASIFSCSSRSEQQWEFSSPRICSQPSFSSRS